jgi:hypothetical protein
MKCDIQIGLVSTATAWFFAGWFNLFFGTLFVFRKHFSSFAQTLDAPVSHVSS